MVDELFSQLHKELNDSHKLSFEERGNIRDAVYNQTVYKNAGLRSTRKKGVEFFGSLAIFRFVTIALIVGLTGGTSIVAAAEQSMPGDYLYSVKIEFSEELRSRLQNSPEKKAQYNIERIEKRFAEAQILAEQDNLTPEKQEIVVAAVKSHTKKFHKDIADIALTEPEQHKEISEKLEQTLEDKSVELAVLAQNSGQEKEEQAFAALAEETESVLTSVAAVNDTLEVVKEKKQGLATSENTQIVASEIEITPEKELQYLDRVALIEKDLEMLITLPEPVMDETYIVYEEKEVERMILTTVEELVPVEQAIVEEPATTNTDTTEEPQQEAEPVATETAQEEADEAQSETEEPEAEEQPVSEEETEDRTQEETPQTTPEPKVIYTTRLVEKYVPTVIIETIAIEKVRTVPIRQYISQLDKTGHLIEVYKEIVSQNDYEAANILFEEIEDLVENLKSYHDFSEEAQENKGNEESEELIDNQEETPTQEQQEESLEETPSE